MQAEQRRASTPKKKRKRRKERGGSALVVLLAVVAGIFLWCNADLDNRYSSTIPQYRSTTDKDGDGIDDQTDILRSARDYVATKPKYKSQYYEGGYPNDGYGVCTDVIAQALLGAGYDLRELVSKDIQAHPALYRIQQPDKNIDFRRVRNLNIYFSRTAISLTTDVNSIECWQGGDIVVMNGHIGIVSDRRNRYGVPYLIHHGSADQRRYEQDVLGNRDDITGHYRIS